MLNPSSIALVGATEGSAWSSALVGNLRGHGYEGRLHLVNPRHSNQFGLPCHPSVSAIGEAVDCAYVMVGTESQLRSHVRSDLGPHSKHDNIAAIENILVGRSY